MYGLQEFYRTCRYQFICNRIVAFVRIEHLELVSVLIGVCFCSFYVDRIGCQEITQNIFFVSYFFMAIQKFTPLLTIQ